MVTYVTCQSEKLTRRPEEPAPLGALTLGNAIDTVPPFLGHPTRSSMLNLKMRLAVLFAVLVSAFALAGCGHGEDEWQAAQRDIAKLKADLDASNKRHTDDEQKYTDS